MDQLTFTPAPDYEPEKPAGEAAAAAGMVPHTTTVVLASGKAAKVTVYIAREAVTQAGATAARSGRLRSQPFAVVRRLDGRGGAAK
jgi:hypothetical protein